MFVVAAFVVLFLGLVLNTENVLSLRLKPPEWCWHAHYLSHFDQLIRTVAKIENRLYGIEVVVF